MRRLRADLNPARRQLLVTGMRIAAASVGTMPALAHAGQPDRVKFALIGDTPYGDADESRLATVIKSAATEASFTIHVGDIKGGRESCGKKLLAHRINLLDASPKPMIVIPGDNEWTDCSRKKAGNYKPVKRLKLLRKLMYPDQHALGGGAIEFERPDIDASTSAMPDPHKEPEFFRFESGPCLFVAINVPGSKNALTKHISDKFNRRRAALCQQWLLESMRVAVQRNLPGLVVLLHANPEFDESSLNDDRHAVLDKQHPYGWVRSLLMRTTAQFPGTVLVLHGDRHLFINDHPFTDVARELQTSERWGVPTELARERLRRLIRVQSFGSPLTSRHVIIEARRREAASSGDSTLDVIVATRVTSDPEP